MISPYILCMFLSVVVASISQILLKKSAMKQYSSVIREYLNVLVMAKVSAVFNDIFPKMNHIFINIIKTGQ